MTHLKTKIALIFFIIGCLSASAQFLEFGKPFMDNYTSRDYHRESQNYSVVQDSNGIMYFGNLNGLMQFDGQEWIKINLTGMPKLCKTKKGNIFYGAYQSFGRLITDKYGKIKLQDLSKGVIDAGFTFENVEQMEVFGNNIVINAPPYIFVIDSLLNAEYVIKAPDAPLKIVSGKRPLILLKDSLVRLNLNNYSLRKCDIKNYSDIKEIFAWRDIYLVGKHSGEWSVYNKAFEPTQIFNRHLSEVLNKTKIELAMDISDRLFVFGTDNCGIIIIDSLTQIVSHINESNGMKDNDVNGLFFDKNNNLWAALNNGICVLSIPSIFTTFDKDYGIQGTILDIVKHQDRIYIASTQGLFVSPLKPMKENCGISKFLRIRPISQQCTSFFKFKNQLWVTNVNGIYKINGQAAEKVSNIQAYNLIESDYYQGVIWGATPHGVSVFKVSDGQLERRFSIPNFKKEVETISETNKGNLWLGTEFEGLYHINLNGKLKSTPKVTHYKESNGLPKNHGWADVYKTNHQLYFSTQKGIFTFNQKENHFEKIHLADSLDQRWYAPIVEDNNGNIWFSSGENVNYTNLTGVKYHIPNTDSFRLVTEPFISIKDHTIESIYIDKDNIAWLGSNEGLLRFNTQNMSLSGKPHKVIIRNMIFGQDTLISNLTNPSEYLKIDYDNNNLQIWVSTDTYHTQDEVYFQFWLEGLETSWGKWKIDNFKQYSGLFEGKYTLHIRSKNIYGEISKPIALKFKVKPPYYRSIWAHISYLALAFLVVYILLQYRAYLHRKEKYVLEKVIREKTEEIIVQKERAEDLVKSILPTDGKEQLENSGKSSRKKYEMATVLFSDVQGFTKIAQGLSPESLLDEIDQYVMEFDSIVGKYGIEKIKTIGDAYMCAGGIPNKNRTNPIDVVLAGLQMLHYTKEMQKKSEHSWGIRFGVHTGSVIAGVVGTRKVSYDIWGDTVNIASRMESYGEVGQLNISHSTYELVSSYFDCDFRGTLPVKYKGNMEMYFVRGLKFEYASDYERITPNEKFLLKMQYLRFPDLEDLILTKLEKGLDERLYYHDVKHTIDVVNMVEIIGIGEGVNEEEMLLLKTAALFHDLGHTISFKDHEEQGIVFAKEILPKFYYSEEQIETISELIFATKFPPKPTNKLEEIICDADLDYLGRSDFIPTSHKLYLEMFEHGKVKNIDEWNNIQVSFLKSHQYYTQTARNTRQVNKMEQLRLIEEQIKKAKQSKE